MEAPFLYYYKYKVLSAYHIKLRLDCKLQKNYVEVVAAAGMSTTATLTGRTAHGDYIDLALDFAFASNLASTWCLLVPIK